MLKKTANNIIKAIEKSSKIETVVFHKPYRKALIVYLEGDLQKKNSKILKEFVESFSNKKVQVEFKYPNFLYIEGENVKNNNTVVVDLRIIDC